MIALATQQTRGASAAPLPGTPNPLPGTPNPPMPNPGEELRNIPLVAITGIDHAGKAYGRVYQAGARFDETRKAEWGNLLPSTGSDMHFGGTSFAAAVQVANSLARNPSGIAPHQIHAAHAVLQASDGAFYVTTLRATDYMGSWAALRTDPRESGSTNPAGSLVATPTHPSVKAVVGAYNWVNLSDEAYDPKTSATAPEPLSA